MMYIHVFVEVGYQEYLGRECIAVTNTIVVYYIFMVRL